MKRRSEQPGTSRPFRALFYVLFLGGVVLTLQAIIRWHSASARRRLHAAKGHAADGADSRAVYPQSAVTLSLPQRVLKRGFDIVTASTALVLLGLPMLLLSALVRLKLGSPVLFRQVRPGRHGQPFTILKFRTMTDERGTDGALLPDARRLTPIGQFLRSSSLDELPSLLNILRGEMSIVGPRPLVMEYLPYYTEEQNLRHAVRPGITGLAQISGRNYLPFSRRLELDVEYVQTFSFWRDLRLIIRTVGVVLAKQNVSKGESVAIVDDINLGRGLNENFFKE